MPAGCSSSYGNNNFLEKQNNYHCYCILQKPQYQQQNFFHCFEELGCRTIVLYQPELIQIVYQISVEENLNIMTVV